ncbi:MAG: strawberry notch C-terminal domain-containing protein [Alphaproteobacteria bacterium]|uniref:Strawberry notch C-terminal domain-containing protein n=1 Tax=Candidatus Nitrobium versatile TaxID=2884831 RepID=A0A953SID2_9BACT|nr:strawberry notch C-terminal domain-containing protein [Candidatus Nitrobium versatile]
MPKYQVTDLKKNITLEFEGDGPPPEDTIRAAFDRVTGSGSASTPQPPSPELDAGAASLIEQARARREFRGEGGAPASSPKPENLAEEVAYGVRQGYEQLKGLGYGLAGHAGHATGIDSLREWGFKGYEEQEKEAQKYAGSVESYRDVNNLDDALKYAAHGLGTIIPTMVGGLGAGAIGARLARTAAKTAVERSVAKIAADELTKKALVQAGLKKVTQKGAAAGATTFNIGMETGEIAGAQHQEGEVDTAKALLGGVLAGSLEAVAQTRLFGKLGLFGGKGAMKAGKGFLNTAKAVGTEGGKQALLEGATEGAQTVIERAFSGQEVQGDAAVHDYINSMLIGAIGGGVFGGAAGLLAKPPATDPAVEARAKERVEGDPAFRNDLRGFLDEAVPNPTWTPGEPPVPLPASPTGEAPLPEQPTEQPKGTANPYHIQFIADIARTSEGPSRIVHPETGEVEGRLGSGRPEWLQEIMAQYKGMKFKGKALTYANLGDILEAAKSGRLLSTTQRNFVKDLLAASQSDYEKAGKFAIDPTELRKGDRIIVDGEEFEHKGIDERTGEAILKDGEIIRVDPFESGPIKVDALIPVGEREGAPPVSTEEARAAEPEAPVVYRNEEHGIAVHISQGDRGYAVAVQDMESGEFLPTVKTYKTREEAETKVQEVMDKLKEGSAEAAPVLESEDVPEAPRKPTPQGLPMDTTSTALEGPLPAEPATGAEPIFTAAEEEKARQAEKEMQEKQEAIPLPKGDINNPDVAALASAFKGEVEKGAKINRMNMLQIAARHYGVTPRELTKSPSFNPRLVDEAYEYAVVQKGREIAADAALSDEEKFEALKKVYADQPNLSQRTSSSMKTQQYSTPLPLAWLMGRHVGVGENTKVYEPTGGTGMLLVGANPKNVTVNELDANTRKRILEASGYGRFLNKDALKVLTEHPELAKSQDAVLMNPPFGSIKKTDYQGFAISKLEHLIALKSLEAMKDDGKAALIIGGHNFEKGRMTEADRVFLNYLYSHYNVTHNIDIDGDVYEKQGTSSPIRLITLSGRKAAPDAVYAPKSPEQVEKAETLDEVKKVLTRNIPGGIMEEKEGGPGNVRGTGDVRSGGLPERPDTGVSGGERGQPGSAEERAGRLPGDKGVGRPASGNVEDRGGGGGGVVPDQPGNRSSGGRGTSIGEPGGVREPNEPGGVSGTVHARKPGVSLEEELGSLSREDLEKAFDEAVQEVAGEKEKPAATPPPRPVLSERSSVLPEQKKGPVTEKKPEAPAPHTPGQRSVADILKDAAAHGVTGIEEAVAGLHELFGGSSLKTFPGSVDAETYAKAKPHFQKAFDEFSAAGKGISDFLKFIVSKFGAKVKDYILHFLDELKAGLTNEFQVSYIPFSKGRSGSNLIPKNLVDSVRAALEAVREQVGDIDEYVRQKLAYGDRDALYDSLSAEQIDAFALFVYNHENRAGKATIIGDQTGVGKGRVAAAIMRYANLRGLKPLFVTKDPKLFSDIYRDLQDINHDIRPFIMHSDKERSSIVDMDGAVLIEPAVTAATKKKKFREILNDPATALAEYDAVFLPYLQLKDAGKIDNQVFAKLAEGNIVILDEAHQASGIDSNTGKMIREALTVSEGAVYLSATYAKRPDNMPLYFRTSLGETGMPIESLINVVQNGGVPLQQVIADILAKMGEYIRRELDFTGVEIKTNINTEGTAFLEKESDRVTERLRDIKEFDTGLKALITMLNREANGLKIEGGGKIEKLVNHTDFASVVHNFVSQFLASTKVDSVVDLAVQELEKGRKPVITLMNTMENVLDFMVEDFGVKVGDTVDDGFRTVLRKALEGTLTYTVTDPTGKKSKKKITRDQLVQVPGLLERYDRLTDQISKDAISLQASFIDTVKSRLKERGYAVTEITGRKYFLDYTSGEPVLAVRSAKEIKNRNEPVNGFNDGTYDVMILNAAGSTGLSLHSSERFQDKRPRTMIVMQADLNVDTHMQTMGRVFRKGQVNLPEYYNVYAGLPSELRPAMVIQKKMASLNANTSANTGSALSLKNVEDIFNHYGDKIVTEYLKEHPDLTEMMGLHEVDVEDIARKATGKAALLPVARQKEFFEDIQTEYRNLIEYLNQTGENNLTAKDYDFGAQTLSKNLVFKGTNEKSPFMASTYLEKLSVKMLNKPYRREKVVRLVNEALNGRTADKVNEDLLREMEGQAKAYYADLLERRKKASDKPIQELRSEIEAEAAEARRKIERLMEKYRIGHSYTVNAAEGYFAPGVLVALKYNASAGNPYAPSKLSFVFALADPMQSISIPASREALQYTLYDDNAIPGNWDEIIPSELREHRYVLTGNLIRGFEALGKRAEVVMYTKEDGTTGKGILLPRSIKDPEAEFSSASVGYEEAYKFLTRGARREELIYSTNGEVTLSYNAGYGEMAVYVPRAKNTGEKYYQNPTLLGLTTHKDFVKSGNKMRAFVSTENVKEFMRVLASDFSLTFKVPAGAVKQGDVKFSLKKGWQNPAAAKVAAAQRKAMEDFARKASTPSLAVKIVSPEEANALLRRKDAAKALKEYGAEGINESDVQEGMVQVQGASTVQWLSPTEFRALVILSESAGDWKREFIHEKNGHIQIAAMKVLKALGSNSDIDVLMKQFNGNEEAIVGRLMEYADAVAANARRPLLSRTAKALFGRAIEFLQKVRSYLLRGEWKAENQILRNMLGEEYLKQYREVRGERGGESEILADSKKDLLSPDKEEVKNFHRQLERWEKRELHPLATLTVSKTPEVLRRLGAEQLPVVIDQSTLKKVIHPRSVDKGKHGISVSMIRQLPQQLHNPVMVFDSATQKNSLVVMTELQQDDKTIVIAMHLSKKKGYNVVNDIASIHPRERDSHIVGWMKKGLLRYYNKEKTHQWLRSRGLQLPPEATMTGSTFRILSNEDIVKGSAEPETSFSLAGKKAIEGDIPPVESDFEAVEKRMTEAEGIKKAPFLERLKQGAERAYRSFRRHFVELDPARDARAIDILYQAEQIGIYAKKKAAQDIRDLIGALKPNEYKLFTRTIILEDLLRDIESGLLQEELPFGYTDEGQVRQDYERFKSTLEATQSTSDAYRKRQEYMRTLRERLVSEDLLPESVLADDRYFHHQVLEYMGMQAMGLKHTGTSAGDLRMTKKGWQRARTGSALDFNTDYLQAEFEVVSQALSQLELKRLQQELKRAADISGALKQRAKEEEVPWKTLLPEDYTLWQPKEGNAFFRTWSLTEKGLLGLLEHSELYEKGELGFEEFMGAVGAKKVLAMGRRREEWAIPKRLAETLEHFTQSRRESAVGAASKYLVNSWKQWVLLNPLRVVKYNLNNLSGDLDIALAYNPRMLSYMRQATKDLYAEMKGALPPDARGELETALKKGVLSSGLTLQEIPDINETGLFSLLTGKEPNRIARYWQKTKDFTTLRENVLRLAAYRFFKDELAAGRQVYGASERAQIDALAKRDDKAAKLARELIGDYGNISEAGQWLRNHMIPFFSWIEINAPRYYRLLKNLKHEGESTKALSGVMAWKATKLGLKASLLYGLVMLWNSTFFPDEEEELGRGGRKQLHLILGRTEDGSIRSLRFQGALSDALSWFGLENYPQDFKDVRSGKVPFSKKLAEAARAPVNKVVQSFRPFEKGAYEIATGKAVYPDVFSPRPVRDKAEHAFRMLALDAPYRWLAGKPSRGADVEAEGVLLYRTDPGEAAYYDTVNHIRDFLKEKGYEPPDVSPTKKSNVLYHYKQAKRYKDKAAAEKYKAEYLSLGGKKEDLLKSYKKTEPIAFLPLKYRAAFLASLDAEDRAVYHRARTWWESVYR